MNISKKIKISISKLLVITLLLSLCVGALPGMAYAEEESRQLSPEEAYITSVVLKVDGVEITADNVNQDPIGQNSQVELSINWELADSTNINTGGYIEVPFPVQYFQGLSGYEGGPLVSNGETIGNYSFSNNGNLKLTFNATTQLNVKGTVTISGLNFTIPSGESNPVQIVFPVSGSAITYVKFQPKNVDKTLTKKGNANSNLNASYIDWEVDLNKKLEHITNAVIEDSIPENLILDENSIEIQKLAVGLDGNAAVTGSAITGIVNSGTAGELKIALGEIDGAYRIKYRTTIAPEGVGKTSFTNEVKLSGGRPNTPEGLIEKVPWTVETPRGAVLKKGAKLGQAYNPKSVDWTVYVNLGETKINKAIIEDDLPEGLALQEPVKVIPIKYNGSEWINDGPALTTGYTVDVTKNPLKVTFDDSITKAYKLEYTTNITDRTQEKFINSANIYDTDESSPLNQSPAKASVDIQRGVYLFKSGADYIDYNSKFIDWTIDINTKEELINNPVLKDVIGSGLKKPVTNLKIVKLNIGSTGTATEVGGDISGNYTITDTTDGYQINFGSQITGAYRITYRTDINDVNLTSYSNKATLEGTVDGKGIGIGDGKKDLNGWDVTKKPLIKNTVDKAIKGVDYANKTISWEITIDPKKEPMENLKIIDTFQTVFSQSPTDKKVNGGLELVSGSAIVLKVGDSEPLRKGIDYTLSPNPDWKSGFVISFLHDVENGVYTIQYKTSFDREWSEKENYVLKGYQNTAVGQWDEKTGHKTDDDNVKFQGIIDAASHNGAKDGTAVLNGAGRAEREIDWNIDVNYLSEKLNNFTVTDNGWDNGQLKLKADSIKIYNLTISGNGKATPGSEVIDLSSAGIKITKDDDGFVIKFGSVTSPYRITYTTELLNQSQAEYMNTATVTGTRDSSETPVSDTMTKKVTFPNNQQNTFLKKTGKQRDTKPYIDWTIQFNTSLSLIKDAVLTDTLSAGHNYVYGSIRVEKLGTGGGYTEVFPGDTTYKLNITEDPVTRVQSFHLEFMGEIKNEYRITYATKILDSVANGASLGNKVEFSGNGITTTNDNEEKSIPVQKISSSGSASGEKGEFTITKVDTADINKKLQGAKFQLLKKGTNEIVYDSLLTGDDGTVTVLINRGGITNGEYYLKEIVAPDGYQLPDFNNSVNWLPVTLDTSKFNAITVTNQKYRKLIIKKTDQATSTEKLQGAEFEIKNSAGNVVANITTNSNGTASVDNLKFDTYTVTEVKAPNGYVAGTPIQVQIDNTKMEFEVTVKNQKVTVTPTAEPSKQPTGTPVSPTPTVPTGTPTSPTPTEPTGTPVSPTPTVPTNTPTGPTPTGSTNTTSTPTPTPTAAVSTTPAPTKTPSATPTPTATVSTTPAPTKMPSSTPTPAPSSKPTLTPTPTPKPIIEITPENTPKGGKVPVPEGSTASPGQKPDNGKITVDKDGKWTYAPEPGFTGKDEFTITVTHPDGKKEEVVVHIDVNKVPFGNPDNGKKGSDDNGKGVHIPKTGEKIPMAVLPVAVTGIVAGIIAFAGRKKKLRNSK
ncbi:Uncharacterized surface anchored protein [Anaerocolumna jejuensis DSM 15929]|uniref:Uncharacterized surface anchored protein n=1 Tax=Anaerocolumna jejuensis DSM 15929 TaxID=1121322 RepID=A0A1M6XIL2_9FIRM|nr:collagen binding domain-containing protein [Anaerocolumna jejuensis]SHL05807.1 Uncharacterized surface anchored protein [Anaerocolumna jejuensis DSM 15929]